MTRLIFLTFYGNERFELTGRSPPTRCRWCPAAPTTRVALADADADADSDPSPTVSYGDAGAVPGAPAATARVAGHDDRPDPGARRRSPRSIGLHQPAVPRARLPRPVARAVVPARARSTSRRRSSRASTLEVLAVILALVGIAHRVPLYRRGPRRAGPRPARRAARRRRARCSGNAYYYDEGIAPPRRRPGRARSPGSSTGSSTRRSSTARSTASASSSKAAARGLRQVQDGYVRRYALGIAFGAVALLLYVADLGGPVAIDRLPDPLGRSSACRSSARSSACSCRSGGPRSPRPSATRRR